MRVLGLACVTLAALAAGFAPPAGARYAEPSAASSACVIGEPPVVRLRPAAARVGAIVRLRGRCFAPHLDLRETGYGMVLIRQFARPRECELLAAGRQRLRVDGEGIARGFFVVPARGSCFQQDYGRRVTPGRYTLAIGCHACAGATLRVRRARGG